MSSRFIILFKSAGHMWKGLCFVSVLFANQSLISEMVQYISGLVLGLVQKILLRHFAHPSPNFEGSKSTKFGLSFFSTLPLKRSNMLDI